MNYQLTEIFQKATPDDAKFIIETLDSYINFTNDAEMKAMLSMWESGPMPIALAHKLEKEIRYVGSSDIAYWARKIGSMFLPVEAGVSINEVIDDVYKTLKINIKGKVDTIEKKLEIIVEKMIGETFYSLTSEEQIELLKKLDTSEEQRARIIDDIKSNKRIISVLISVLGMKAAEKIVSAIIFRVIAVFLGKKAAEKLIKEILKKNPWMAFLGPIAIVSLVQSIVDLAGPAMRKTIPIVLYLGLIAIRDGLEDIEE
ncbi:MAG: hypothetical protein J1E80_04970 [Desulfovibrionaceae bacterium]|nr:hypothetical protein [Desulfovibrionaceae bacterium]